MGQLFITPLADDAVNISELLPAADDRLAWEAKKRKLAEAITWSPGDAKVVTINNQNYGIEPLSDGLRADLHDRVQMDDTMVHDYNYLANGLKSPSIFSVYNKPNSDSPWCYLFHTSDDPTLKREGNVATTDICIARLTIGTIYDSFVKMQTTVTDGGASNVTSTINKLCVFNGLYHARHKVGVFSDSVEQIHTSVRWVVWYDGSSSSSSSSSSSGPSDLFRRICNLSTTLHPTVAFLNNANEIPKENAKRIRVSNGSYYICHIRHIRHIPKSLARP